MGDSTIRKSDSLGSPTGWSASVICRFTGIRPRLTSCTGLCELGISLNFRKIQFSIPLLGSISNNHCDNLRKSVRRRKLAQRFRKALRLREVADRLPSHPAAVGIGYLRWFRTGRTISLVHRGERHSGGQSNHVRVSGQQAAGMCYV